MATDLVYSECDGYHPVTGWHREEAYTCARFDYTNNTVTYTPYAHGSDGEMPGEKVLAGIKVRRGQPHEVLVIIADEIGKFKFTNRVKLIKKTKFARIWGQRQPDGLLYVSSEPTVVEYPRSDDDGRCLLCEGWGCWHCGCSGGY